jgi:hypothetical protein
MPPIEVLGPVRVGLRDDYAGRCPRVQTNW